MRRFEEVYLGLSYENPLFYYYTPRQRKLIGQHNPQSEQGRVRSNNVAYTTALIPLIPI